MAVDDLHAREQAVIHLARGLRTDDVGELIGMSGRSVRRWLEDPDYAASVTAARRALLAEAVAALGVVVRDSVAVLGDALKDASPAIRVRAALGALSALPSLSEHAEFAERIAALERAVADRGGAA